MKRRLAGWVVLAALAASPVWAQSARLIPGTGTELPRLVTKAGKTYKLGKKPYPAGTRDQWIAEGKVLAKTPAGILPTGKKLKGAADNRSYMPPIGDQGYEGSCVHWAGTYYTKTANMKRNDPSINVNAASNQCSPRFTYNLTNAGEDSGGYGHEPFEVFMRYGVASLAQKPYDDEQFVTLPVAADFVEGLHRRSTNYVWLWDWAPDAGQIAELKAWLDDGRIAACGVNAETSFDAWGPGDAPWVGDTGTTLNDINHMVTVCGYGEGYYLVANSWDTSFGSNGYIVVDSDYFENYFSDVIYPVEGTYEPATDYAKLTVRHGTRSDIQELEITANGETVWNHSPLPKDMPIGDPSGVFVEDTRDNLDVAIDLTQVAWGEANVVTARVRDAVSAMNGTVTVFAVTYDGVEYDSPSVPVPVTYNTDATAGVRLYQSTDTNVCFTSYGASVNEGSGLYEVTVYKTQASGDVGGQIVLSGTATEGADYTVSSTNFTMNGATTSATFTVTLIDDEEEELSETIVMTLANVTGGIVQAPDVFTLTLNPSDLTGGSIVISQYTETDTGTSPKGIEIWNASASPVTFDGGANLLDVKVGMNGGAPASVVQVDSGTLAAGDVMVIGTPDMSPDVEEAFSFNGNDSIAVELGGVVQDVIGTPGVDPGSAWEGNGVSTANQNIQLKLGITFGEPNGWTDPSERFEFVAVGSDLTGFGEPPGGFSDLPPVLAPIGSQFAITNQNLSFVVSAEDAVDNDSIVLSAGGLPAGAVFAAVTNAGTVSNTFVWNNVGPVGTYTVTFTATDKDGSDSEEVVITIGDGTEPIAIVFQGFEGSPADTWTITDIDPNLVSSSTGTGDTPANQRVRTGSYSWQPGQGEYTTESMELGEVDISQWSDVVLTLHLSATTTEI
ncbi:MAG: hypothetical protein GX548_11595, partial [Lentisphaerae bacterium]|nr:hypothetical protein [Lentisphaerota bacterium]